jgi:hypothetical protein
VHHKVGPPSREAPLRARELKSHERADGSAERKNVALEISVQPHAGGRGAFDAASATVPWRVVRRARAGCDGTGALGFAARLVGSLSAARNPYLVVAAAAPFVPGIFQFIHHGLADVLFTGDAAAIELRTLHAAHGTQLLGPYSRFRWSHPGPALFYLALPLYEVFHRQGPALDLFAFVANLSSAVALVLSARRLGGAMFALAAATLLAAYESIGMVFQLSYVWNPFVSVLPLGLLSLLCARILLGEMRLLPVFTFVASAVVQTHVGYLPVVASLSLLGATTWLVRTASRRSMWKAAVPTADPRSRPRFPSVWAALAVFAVVWLPPVVDCVEHPPGNLLVVARFFLEPHASEHPWPIVLDVTSRQLLHTPIAIAQALGLSREPSAPTTRLLAAALVCLLVAAVAAGLRRSDRAVVALSAVALVEIVSALAAVRSVRGDILFYLVTWISMVGLVALIALLRLAFGTVLRESNSSWRTGLPVAAALVVGLLDSVRVQASVVDVVHTRDEGAEQFAREVHGYLVSHDVQGPLIRIEVHDAWPTAVAVVLYLFKHRIPIFVSDDWLFMVGEQFAAESAKHPLLLIGDRSFFEASRTRHDLHFVSAVGETSAFLSEPHYLDEHRIASRATVVSANGVRGNPSVAVDGVSPAEGARWDAPQSLVLESTASVLEVSVPRERVAAVLLSVDSGDVYVVRCRGEDGSVVALGAVKAYSSEPGMAVVPLYSDALQSCRAVQVSPQSGDGYYSVGEVGFLRP